MGPAFDSRLTQPFAFFYKAMRVMVGMAGYSWPVASSFAAFLFRTLRHGVEHEVKPLSQTTSKYHTPSSTLNPLPPAPHHCTLPLTGTTPSASQNSLAS